MANEKQKKTYLQPPLVRRAGGEPYTCVIQEGTQYWLVAAGKEATRSTKISKPLHDAFVAEAHSNAVKFKQMMANEH